MARNPSTAPGTAPGYLAARGPLRWLLAVRHPYADELDQQRATAVALMSLILGSVGVVGMAVLAIWLPGVLPTWLIPVYIVLAAAYFAIPILLQKGRLFTAYLGFVALTLLVPAVQSIPSSFLRPEIAALSYIVSIVAAAFLFGPGWTFPVAGLVVLLVGAGVYIQDVGSPQLLATLFSAQGMGTPVVMLAEALLLMGVFSLLVWLLSRNLFAWAYNAQRRARQIEAAVEISQVSASASLRALLTDSVERIRDAYGFYHAQVFLLDQERRMARLEASTGHAGEMLLARGHALAVGSQSIIGQCTASGQPVVVNNVDQSAIHRPNELLPNTRAELALPLQVGDGVIGALDVQSTQSGAFQPDDVRSLLVLAAQLASAIEKARLVEQLRSRADENQRLFEDAQRSLAQIEDLNRRLTREGWADFLRARRAGTLGYTLQGEAIQPDTAWTAPMRQAYQGESSVVVRHDQQAHIAALPVRVRGEVIGVLEVERGAKRPWTEAELEMAEVLVERLALAIENARLYEQATDAAEREQILNQIAQDVQEASSIDQVLRSALAELGQVLGASRGIVQLSSHTPPPAAGPDNSRTLPERGVQEV